MDNFYQSNILSIITFMPLVAAVVLLFMPRTATSAIKGFALAAALATLALSVPLYFWFDGDSARMQFVAQTPWISILDNNAITYHVGIDGISLFLVLLTTFIMPIAIVGSYSGITDRLKEYYALMLMLETGMLGVFVSLDMILFYVFWEAMLIPMYFIIGIWGGRERIYAAVKFFLYTMAGSLLMLVAIIAMAYTNYLATGTLTFNLLELYGMELTRQMQALMFFAYGIAFAIKVPMFPFHTWLPDAHVQAPTAGSVILAAVMLKMGTYGFLRFCLPLFPDAAVQYAPLLVTLAIIGIIYGALVALVQPDMKKLVAYSSVSHLGVSMLGIFVFTTEGLQGGMVSMISHGFTTGALFLLVGMIYERRHTREIAQFGGIWTVMPKYGALFIMVTMASIGLPFMSGFVGEFLVFLGAWIANPWYAVFAATGLILSACYMLWMLQRVLQGPLDNEENKKLTDINAREVGVLVPLVVASILVGVFPSAILLNKMEPTLANLSTQMQQAKANANIAEQPATVLPEGVVEAANPSQSKGAR